MSEAESWSGLPKSTAAYQKAIGRGKLVRSNPVELQERYRENFGKIRKECGCVFGERCKCSR